MKYLFSIIFSVCFCVTPTSAQNASPMENMEQLFDSDRKEKSTTIADVKIALKDLGYDVDVTQNKNVLDVQTKKSLIEFCWNHSIPLSGVLGKAHMLRILFEQQEKVLQDRKNQEYRMMRVALKDLGYNVDTTYSLTVDTLTKKAFTKFQKDYGAPICELYPLRFLFEQHDKFLEKQKSKAPLNDK